jgi:thiol-disulfide isomerase/thioredoxin
MLKSTLISLAMLATGLGAAAQIDTYWQSLHTELGVPLNRATVDSVMSSLKSQPELYREMADKAEEAFYRPGSPLCDDVTYEMFLTRILSDSVIDPTTLSRYEFQLTDVRKNFPGTKAADFEMVDKARRKLTLYDAAPAGAMTLLVFYDPDCGHCHTTFDMLRSNPHLANLVKAQKIKVIAVYADSDPDVWKNNLVTLPADWVNAWTPEASVEDLDLYMFPEMPSIYLLDADKVVMRKNITPEHLLPVLESLDR